MNYFCLKSIIVSVVIVSMAIACGDKDDKGDEEDLVFEMDVSPATVTAAVGETFTITATFESSALGWHTVYFDDDESSILNPPAGLEAEVEGGSVQETDYPSVGIARTSDYMENLSGTASAQYACTAAGETTITVSLTEEDEDLQDSGGQVDGETVERTVDVTCTGGDEECGESHSVYGPGVTLAALLQFQAAAFCALLDPVSISTILHSSNSVGEKDVANDHTTLRAVFATTVAYTAQQVTQLFSTADFPCGDGPNGHTVCPSSRGPMPEGDYVVAAAIFEDAIPLNDSGNQYQYGIVWDSDDDNTNNYEASSSYPNDFFHATDFWVTADYTSSGGWTMTTTDATGGSPSSVQSDARMIIGSNALFLVIPASEFESAAPPFRMTAFRHTGDYGMNPPNDWDGSLWPAVADGLESFPTSGAK